MIAVYIIGGLLLLIGIILIVPVTVDFKLDGDFFVKIKILGIKVYSVKPEKDIKNKKSIDTESDKQAEKQEKKFFEKLSDKLGFTGAVKEMISLTNEIIKAVKGFLNHILFNRVCIKIVVASENAASTAIQYGIVCTAVYPLANLFDNIANVKLKQVNVISDFNSTKPSFMFSTSIKIRVIYFVKLMLAIFKNYKSFKERNGL